MENKSVNPKLKQSQIAEELGCSTSFLQRYRHDIKMQSPYKAIGPKRTPKNSNDIKRSKMTSKNFSPIIETVRPNTSKENKLKGGSLNENLEIDDT